MTSLSLAPIRAVIFDLDGTLVSSTLDFPAIRRDINCPEGQDILQFIDSLENEQRAKAQETVLHHEMQDALSVSVNEGVLDLLSALKRYGLYTGIVTRNSMVATVCKTKAVNLNVDTILTRECAPPKPDPGALLNLCKQWGIDSRQAIYVGDFLYDLQAAENALMHSCLYAPETIPEYADKAGFVCQHFVNFLAQLQNYLRVEQ